MAMSESGPATSPSESECRHDKVREWIIDALSLATAGAAVSHYNPDGILATIIIAAGASVVGAVVWRTLWVLSSIMLASVGVLIYFFTLMHAMSFGLPAMVLAMFVPGIAQAYVIWALWAATGTLLHPLMLMCLAWLVLLGICLFEQKLFAGWRPRRSKVTSLC